MMATTEELVRLRDEISAHAEAIERLFAYPVRVTVFARVPGQLETGCLVSSDQDTEAMLGALHHTLFKPKHTI